MSNLSQESHFRRPEMERILICMFRIISGLEAAAGWIPDPWKPKQAAVLECKWLVDSVYSKVSVKSKPDFFFSPPAPRVLGYYFARRIYQKRKPTTFRRPPGAARRSGLTSGQEDRALSPARGRWERKGARVLGLPREGVALPQGEIHPLALHIKVAGRKKQK